ncbi:MAG: hypothetical protein IPQ07_28185 [Myxococcales bacterium]|nr:hypothetical protein [Myxococcales bacterium]
MTIGPKPAPTGESDVSAVAGGPVHGGQPAPTDFSGFYKREYGIDPRRHAVEVAKALANKERTAQQIGDWLDVIDPSLFAPPVAPSGEEVVIDKTNITLVSPTFSVSEANNRAKKIWDLIHGTQQGAVQLIRQEFGSTQEEDRLINIAFRKLSGGVEIHFFLQQHLAQQKKWEATQGGLDRAGVQVGGGGVGDADKRGVHVVGMSAETEAAAERAATGKISIEKQLSTLITANNMNEVYRVIESATPDERRAILANGDLMTKLRGFGDDSYEWNRIYKSLTGQADLFDKLESRAHGKHGVIGGMFEGTDEKGMTEDIKDHAKKRKVQIRAQLVQQLFGGKEPQNKENKEALEKEVSRRLKIEFQAHLENPSIRSLLDSELSGTELAATEGQLMNTGEENKLASVLTEGNFTEDEEKILEDIKKMSPADRAKARANPEYIAQLRKSIQSQGTWRDAMTLLESNEDGSKGENDDNFAKLERASRSQRQDTTELMFEQHEVIEALSKLTVDEYTRLKANPRLQAQILTSLEGHPAELAKARQMMNFNPADAAGTTGLKIAAEGKEPDPTKGEYSKSAVERLAFLRFSAENQLAVGASRGWGVLLQAGVAVYNMKLTPSEADKATKAQAAAAKDEADKPLDPKTLQPEGGAPKTNGAGGAPKATATAPKQEEAPPPDPKAGEAAIEADLRKRILNAAKEAYEPAIKAWGTQKSEDGNHERTEIDGAKQTSIIEGPSSTPAIRPIPC